MSKNNSSHLKSPEKPVPMDRRKFLGAIGVAAIGSAGALWGFGLFDSKKAGATQVTVYKSPSCGCCGAWADHMSRNGFDVKVENVDDLDKIKKENGIIDNLESCHTALVEGYVIEGHVPAKSVKRLLSERPNVMGLAVPGMPLGSPGMEGSGKERYSVVVFDYNGAIRVYDRY